MTAPYVTFTAELAARYRRLLLADEIELRRRWDKAIADGHLIMAGQLLGDLSRNAQDQRELSAAVNRSSDRGEASFVDGVGRVYSHVTGAHIADPHANPDMVIKFADDRTKALCKEAEERGWRNGRLVGSEPW